MAFFSSLFKPLVYVSPIIFAVWLTPTGQYYIRLGIYTVILLAVSSSVAFIAVAMTFAGRMYDVNSVIAFTLYWLMSRTLNVSVELEGEEHLALRPVVMVGNHQSMFDIFWLARCVNFTFLTLGGWSACITLPQISIHERS